MLPFDVNGNIYSNMYLFAPNPYSGLTPKFVYLLPYMADAEV